MFGVFKKNTSNYNWKMSSTERYPLISELLKCEKNMYLRIDEIKVILWLTSVVINYLSLVEESLDNETVSHL